MCQAASREPSQPHWEDQERKSALRATPRRTIHRRKLGCEAARSVWSSADAGLIMVHEILKGLLNRICIRRYRISRGPCPCASQQRVFDEYMVIGGVIGGLDTG